MFRSSAPGAAIGVGDPGVVHEAVAAAAVAGRQRLPARARPFGGRRPNLKTKYDTARRRGGVGEARGLDLRGPESQPPGPGRRGPRTRRPAPPSRARSRGGCRRPGVVVDAAVDGQPERRAEAVDEARVAMSGAALARDDDAREVDAELALDEAPGKTVSFATTCRGRSVQAVVSTAWRVAAGSATMASGSERSRLASTDSVVSKAPRTMRSRSGESSSAIRTTTLAVALLGQRNSGQPVSCGLHCIGAPGEDALITCAGNRSLAGIVTERIIVDEA